MITQQYLKSRLRYDPETGHFVWVSASKHNPRLQGKRAGTINGCGYRQIKIDYRAYFEHRLAFLYVHGFIPSMIDHINRSKDDNRISNLRECTLSQNLKNHGRGFNGSGLPCGVRRYGRRYQASITCDGVRHYLGYYDTAEEAGAAYLTKRLELYGEFA